MEDQEPVYKYVVGEGRLDELCEIISQKNESKEEWRVRSKSWSWKGAARAKSSS